MREDERSGPEILTIKEVAAALRTSSETVRRKCRAKRIPHFRFFGQIRFRRAEIDAWIDALAEQTLGEW